ncbi:MAG: HigA family addiction module antitoxin [Aquisalinus sp.]|nr:HigA family addiction module antitoxin [Aquisalinus sp.]
MVGKSANRQTPLKISMPPLHPGEFIQTEILEELGLTITEAARHLSVRHATLSDLVNRKSALSPEMALRMELAFGLNAETLLRMQAVYDTRMIRENAPELNVKPYQQPA